MWCKLCCKDGGRPSRPLCKHTRKATPKRSRQTCWCGGMVGKKATAIPHRRGSAGVGLGACEHHPQHGELMHAELERPIRRAK